MFYLKDVKKVFLSLFLLSIVACGDPIPVKEMSNAKMDITSAKGVNAEKYAGEKYKEAKSLLLASHGNVKEDKLEDAKKNALKASEAAKEAYEMSVPLLAKDAIQVAEESLKLADEAAAENLATEDFEIAKGKFQNSQKIFENKKYYDSYLEAVEADKAAKNARNIAISKSSFLKDAIDEVDKTIFEAKRYGAADLFPQELKLAEENKDIATKSLETLSLKQGFEAINLAKVNSDEAYFGSLKESAKKGLETAEVKIAEAEKSPGAKSAEDEIAGAKELLDTARSQFGETQYVESINTANESKRLAGIALAVKVVEPEKDPEADLRTANKEVEKPKEEVKEKKDYVIYRVKLFKNPPKDSLRRISKKYYKSEMKWKKIYKANKKLIKNPDLIKPGWKLKIPIKK